MPWDSGLKKEKNVQCSFLQPPKVYVQPMVKDKIELLMGEYPNQEWLGYLVGFLEPANLIESDDASTTDEILIEDIVIPPHSHATYGSAEAVPFNKPEDTIGIIHSHHKMGASHSGIDDDYIDWNYPISITVGFKGNEITVDAVCTMYTRCGAFTLVKADLVIVKPPPAFDEEAFILQAKANIEQGKTAAQAEMEQHFPICGGQPPFGYPYGYGYMGDYIPIGHRIEGIEGQAYIDSETGEIFSKQEVDEAIASGKQLPQTLIRQEDAAQYKELEPHKVRDVQLPPAVPVETYKGCKRNLLQKLRGSNGNGKKGCANSES